MQYTSVTDAEFAALEGLDDWRAVLRTVQADYRAPSFESAAELVVAIARAAEAVQHHPDIDLRYPGRVRVVLTTHATGGLTTLDVDLARTISGLARDAAATSDPSTPQTVEIAIDTMDVERIRPFWAAVLGYSIDADGSLYDPMRIGPPVWFQQMDAPRTERDRFHLDVNVPHDIAQERIDATIAAGGTMVTDEFARKWWVLADADGNEACICTWQDR